LTTKNKSILSVWSVGPDGKAVEREGEQPFLPVEAPGVLDTMPRALARRLRPERTARAAGRTSTTIMSARINDLRGDKSD
jgi:hypothetical protein